MTSRRDPLQFGRPPAKMGRERGERILTRMSGEEETIARPAYEIAKRLFPRKEGIRLPLREPEVVKAMIEKMCSDIDRAGHLLPVMAVVSLHAAMREAAILLSDEELALAMQKMVDRLLRFPPNNENLKLVAESMTEDFLPDGYDVIKCQRRFYKSLMCAILNFSERDSSAEARVWEVN
jgi:hypothetical protein